MSAHAYFSPSKSEMWMNCPGALSMPENQADGGSSTFADDGTASHTWGAQCLIQGTDAEKLLGATLLINGVTYIMDESRAGYVQSYLDDVRRRAMGGQLFVEYKIDLQEWLGPDQFGTGDAAIYVPQQKLLISQDLKYGQGEKVYASYGPPEDKRPNPQLALYALGLLADMSLFGEIEQVLLVVNQPRLGHIDEFPISVEALLAFGEKARDAVAENVAAAKAHVLDPAAFPLYLVPGEKTCRWCRAKATCPKLASYVQDQVHADFTTLTTEAPVLPGSEKQLSKAMGAVPLVEAWCRAVRADVWKLVIAGKTVIGPDNQPYKLVEGKGGKRVWINEEAAEAALLATVGPEKAYEPRQIVTAPVADKLFKKAQRKQWEDMFLNDEKPLITKTKGSLSLAMGSDPRPPASATADATDFDELGAQD